MNLSKNILWERSGVDVCIIKFQSTLFKMDLKNLMPSLLLYEGFLISDCTKQVVTLLSSRQTQ